MHDLFIIGINVKTLGVRKHLATTVHHNHVVLFNAITFPICVNYSCLFLEAQTFTIVTVKNECICLLSNCISPHNIYGILASILSWLAVKSLHRNSHLVLMRESFALIFHAMIQIVFLDLDSSVQSDECTILIRQRIYSFKNYVRNTFLNSYHTNCITETCPSWL